MNIDSDPLDEITCNNCGRPNLKEAVKCWYCQQPFENDQHSSDESDTLLEDFNSQAGVPRPTSHTEQDVPEDIPEWLQRIRDMKKREQPEEEDKDLWQQQPLFGNSQQSPDEQKSKHPQAVRRPKPARSKENEPSSHQSPPAAPQDNPIDEPAPTRFPPFPPPVQEENETPDDLPDGFIKFDPKSG